jgi:GR25 family glycosyltransferase involved in LPS biosynthesis
VKVCYINLDSAAERRAFVEENFRANNARGWTLERVPALAKGSLAGAGLGFAGISDIEASCFASHVKALRDSAQLSDDLMVVEDDVMFGPESQRLIAEVVDKAPRDKWDIFFTDLVVPGISNMVALYHMRRGSGGKMRLIDIAGLSPDPNLVPVSGATAYVVNRQSLPRLAAEFGAISRITAPYDIYLWQRIAAKTLTAHAIFPFPTTISHFADATQIHTPDAFAADLLWNAFRRLVWVHGDVKDAEATLARIDPKHFDDKSAEIMGRIVAGVLSKHFTGKWVLK